jgi:uncharacterized membrane protein
MKKYWKGFAAGAVTGVAAGGGVLLLANTFGSGQVIRLEKSIQIGKPVNEVFNAWRELGYLPQMSHVINEVRHSGNRSHWRVSFGGRQYEWDAEIEQMIPNQAIGWKSLSGPKHTGRINFSPLGNDTVVHVTMNYAPPSLFLRPFVHPISGHIEDCIEQVFRDFKAALEGKGQEREPAQATGTFGGTAKPIETRNTRFGGRPSAVECTRPPEAKS